jgi:hypothetical protein
VAQTSGSSEQVLSTRSVDVNLARSFKAGEMANEVFIAQRRLKLVRIQLALCDKAGNHLIPALKRRAKLIPTLRVEATYSEVPSVCDRFG